ALDPPVARQPARPRRGREPRGAGRGPRGAAPADGGRGGVHGDRPRARPGRRLVARQERVPGDGRRHAACRRRADRAPLPAELMAHRAGHVAVVGRPNVGKSTLVNALVGAKVAIVSPKPQTTRTRLVGIRSLPEAQIVFVDTPGLHAPRSLINRRMVETSEAALGDADAMLLVLDAAAGVTAADAALAGRLAADARPTIAVLNKRDRVSPPQLLPQMA